MSYVQELERRCHTILAGIALCRCCFTIDEVSSDISRCEVSIRATKNLGRELLALRKHINKVICQDGSLDIDELIHTFL